MPSHVAESANASGNREMEENEEKDCHNEVKSSGLGGNKKRHHHLCCEHRHKLMKKMTRISVACQTDESNLNGCATASSSVSAPVSLSAGSPKKEDGSKSEGTLRLMIQNFRNMSDTVRGPGKTVTGVPWKIMVMPRQHVVAKKGTQKCLGFFLQCCPDSYSDSWSCQASAELRLISQKPGIPNFVRKTNHVYTAKENDWGYSCFMTWADILEESQGYMKDEKVILEVFVKAEPPKGILTHESFCKKITDYMRLAEMQSSRGLTDKAIEVNQTALKFCKDKDDDMKDELEKQKRTLIEMKLKQSIERIEKGKTGPPEAPDESGTNLNTLRQALTGNWQALKRQGGNPTGNGTKEGVLAKNPTGKPVAKAPDSPVKRDEIKVDKIKDEVNGVTEEEVKELEEALAKEMGRHHPEGLTDEEDDDTGPCSSEEGSDDEECSEEFCDSCLQEKLETIGNEEVQTTEMSCQTEAPPSTQNLSQTRVPPVGAAIEAKGKSGSGTTGLAKGRMTAEEEARTRSLISAASKWTPEKEAELLELITQESRASLDSIRDTLERLVSLAQDGEVPPGLEFDLAALRAEQQQRAVANTDIVELPLIEESEVEEPPPPPPAAPKKLAQKQDELNRQIALKKEEQKQLLAAHEKILREQRELKVQEDLTDEEYSLIQHAKEIVETKAEELVTKYSQLIEQSEATRLAETVKKVEKRMKDIEKQTMTCRQELADECERHHREEQRLIKTNKQLRAQVDQVSEKSEKLNSQLKERKAEIKKLEKKLKAENQTSAENAELLSRMESLEKELSGMVKKQSEEAKRMQKEHHSFLEAKKQLQQELTSAGGEIERLNAQLEERGVEKRKGEQKIEVERRQTHNTLREAVERAKKAEMNLLEFKLEMGVKLLQRAQDDCQTNIKHLEEIMKRHGKNQSYESYVGEWQKTRDKISDLVDKAKKDFMGQIELVKSGKPLTSLPVLEVPRPPPPPTPKSLPPQAIPQPTQQTLDQPRQPIAPIGARPSGVLSGLPGVVPSCMAQPVPASSSATGQNISMASPVPASAAPLTNGMGASAPQTTATYNGGQMPNGQMAMGMGTQYQSNTQNGRGGPDMGYNPMTGHTGGQQQMQHLHHSQNQSQANQSESGMKTPPLAVEPQLNGFSPWSDPLSILSDYVFSSHQTRQPTGGCNSFVGGAAGDGGWNSMGAPPPMVRAPNLPGGTFNTHMPPPALPAHFQNQQNQMSSAYSAFPNPPPQHSAANSVGMGSSNAVGSAVGSGQSAGQWGVGWGYQQVMNAPPAASPIPDKNYMRPLSRGASSPGPGGMMDSRGSSPITALNEKQKRVETLMEQLRATFPNFSPDTLREYVNEFRSSQPGKTVKGMSVEQAVNGVVSLILSKNSIVNNNNNYRGEGNFQSGTTLDTFGGGAEGEGCGVCGESMKGQQKATTSLKCRHRFHQKCVKDWLSSRQTCPACGRFNPSPEEYPELGK